MFWNTGIKAKIKNNQKEIKTEFCLFCFSNRKKIFFQKPSAISSLLTLSNYSCWCTEEIWQPFTPTAVVLLCSADIRTHISPVNIPLPGLLPSQGRAHLQILACAYNGNSSSKEINSFLTSTTAFAGWGFKDHHFSSHSFVHTRLQDTAQPMIISNNFWGGQDCRYLKTTNVALQECSPKLHFILPIQNSWGFPSTSIKKKKNQIDSDRNN